MTLHALWNCLCLSSDLDLICETSMKPVFLINLLRHDDKATMFTVTDKNARKIQINKSRICQPQQAKKGNVSVFSFKPVIYANISMRVISMWLMKCLCALSPGSTFSWVTERVRDTACRKAKADINNLR